MSETSTPEGGAGASGSVAAGVQFFGQYLLSKGLISAQALADALAFQQSVNIPLGALALSKGLLSEKQVLHVHTEQRRSDRMFGEIAVLKGFISRQQLDELLRESIGEISLVAVHEPIEEGQKASGISGKWGGNGRRLSCREQHK